MKGFGVLLLLGFLRIVQRAHTIDCPGVKHGVLKEKWVCDSILDCPKTNIDELPCGYRQGYVYQYLYDSTITFPKTNGQHLSISATVQFVFESLKKVSMKVKGVKMSGKKIPSKEWNKVFVIFRTPDGVITRVRFDPSTSLFVLNIKKAMASSFQLKFPTSDELEYDNMETAPQGTFNHKYKVSPVSPSSSVWLHSMSNKRTLGYIRRKVEFVDVNAAKITKKTDYKSGRQKAETQNYLKATDCSPEQGARLPRTRTQTTCLVYKYWWRNVKNPKANDFYKKRKIANNREVTAYTISECVTNETYSVAANEMNHGLFTVNVKKSLKFQKMEFERRRPRYARQPVLSSSSLAMEFEDNSKYVPTKKIEKILKAINAEITPGKEAYKLLSRALAGNYSKLVYKLRMLRSSDFDDVYTRLYSKPEYRQWLTDALPFVATPDAGKHLKLKIENKEIKSSCAIRHLSRLGAHNREASDGLVDYILALCKSATVRADWHVHATCWLTFGSLVRINSKDRGGCKPKYCKALIEEFDKFVHTEEFHSQNTVDMENMVVALKGIENSGQVALLPNVLPLIEWYEPNPIVIGAIEAVRKMTLKEVKLAKVQNALFRVYNKSSNCPEIRMIAFVSLMNTIPSAAMLNNLANIIKKEKTPIVRQYVYTTLKKDSKLNCQGSIKRRKAEKLLAMLVGTPKFDFRKSFAHSFQFGSPDKFSWVMDIEKVHTPLSGVPRYIKMSNRMGMMGYLMDHMEFKIRQDEIVPLLRDLFGPYGSYHEKKSIWDFIRPKRSANNGFPSIYQQMKEKLNPKTFKGKPFKLTMSAKLFGTEIFYGLLNDTNSMIKGLIDDGTMKIDRNWWTNELNAGMNYNMNASDQLVNAKKRFATSAGIPITMMLSSVGVFRYNLNMKFKKPISTSIPWNNAPDVEGTYREGLSLMTDTTLRVYAKAGGVKKGYRMSSYFALRAPVPFDEADFELKEKNGHFDELQLEIKMNKENTSVMKQEVTSHFFTYEKGNYVTTLLGNKKSPSIPGPIPGMERGHEMFKKRKAASGLPPGFSNFLGGNSGGPGDQGFPRSSGGRQQGPHGGMGRGPGAGPHMGRGPARGHGRGRGRGRGPFPSRRPYPGSYQSNSDGVTAVSESSSETVTVDLNSCGAIWNNSLSVCRSIDPVTRGVHAWYYPGERNVKEIVFEVENKTKEGDKAWRYFFELDIDDEKGRHVDQYHLELNVTKKHRRPPHSGKFQPPGYKELFSARVFGRKNEMRKPTWQACMKLGVDKSNKEILIQGGSGGNDTCWYYHVNETIAYREHNGDPVLNISLNWNRLPPKMERLTCPAKHMGQPPPGMGGVPPGMGGVPPGMGGVPPGMGGVPPGMGGVPPGMGGVPPGMGGVPPGNGPQGGGSPPQGGQSGGQPQPDVPGPPIGQPSTAGGFPGGALPCITSLNVRMTIRNGQHFEMYGVPTPDSQVFSYKLPLNVSGIMRRAKEYLKYGVIETCKVMRATNDVKTFDSKWYSYPLATGCPHVLAKDCSKKDLFVVFLKKTADNKKELTVVIKDRLNRGHVFIIRPDLTVLHDGTELKLKASPRNESMFKVHRVCKVIRTKYQVILTCKAGFTIMTCAKRIAVKVSPWYFHYMCGMCGNFDYRPTADPRSPRRRTQKSDHGFAATWMVPGESCSSTCKLVQKIVKATVEGNLKCVTKALRCAKGCVATKKTKAFLDTFCIDPKSAQEKSLKGLPLDQIYNKLKTKEPVKGEAAVHYDCNCNNCPAS